MQARYDYIVVKEGTAGSGVAARLAENLTICVYFIASFPPSFEYLLHNTILSEACIQSTKRLVKKGQVKCCSMNLYS